MLVIRLLFIIFLFSINIAFAGDVSKFVFTPESSQIAKPNEAALLTIQLQYEGDSHPTACMKMFTSSATGEFSSSGANWKKVDKLTINSNWTNKNFYYKDSTAGDYIITVEVVSGVSCANLANQEAQLIASQNITVMSDVVIPDSPPQSEPEPTPSISSSQPISSQPTFDVSSVESTIESTTVVDSTPQPQTQIKSAVEPDKKPEPKSTTVVDSSARAKENPADVDVGNLVSDSQVANVVATAKNNSCSVKKWLMIILGIGFVSSAGFLLIRRQGPV